MDELATPPGYVEYPRDPKFRKVDEIERLELMAKAYSNLSWVSVLITPLFFIHTRHEFQWWRFGFGFLMSTVVALVIRRALLSISRAKGWWGGYPLIVSAMAWAIGCLHAACLFPPEVTLIAFLLVVIVGIYPAGRAVKLEFKKFGLKMPGRLTDKQIQAIVRELREKERAGEAVAWFSAHASQGGTSER